MNVKSKFQEKASVTVTILLLLALMTTAFLYYLFSPDNTSILPRTQMVDLPVITTRVIDEAGEAHNVDTQISIEFTGYVPDTVDPGTLHRLVLDAVTELDYERLYAPGVIEYIQDEIIDAISVYIPREEIVGAYVSEFLSGDIRLASPPPKPAENPAARESSARKLFGGIK